MKRRDIIERERERKKRESERKREREREKERKIERERGREKELTSTIGISRILAALEKFRRSHWSTFVNQLLHSPFWNE